MKIANHRLKQACLIQHHRWHLEKGEALPWHRHHFAELFWIERGSGWQETLEERYRIEAGDLIFMPDQSVHRLLADTSSLIWCNVMVSTEQVASWKKRYGDDWNTWPWDQSGMYWRISNPILCQLSHQLMKLHMIENSQAKVDQWFLNLWQLMDLSQSSHAHAPSWLTEAMEVLRSPQGLQEGLPALVNASGRCPDHLARVIKKYYGTRPSLLIRDRRLEHAAALLRTTGDSILNISLDCGFENSSYFARVFKMRFGTTPLHYRKGQAAIGTMIPIYTSRSP